MTSTLFDPLLPLWGLALVAVAGGALLIASWFALGTLPARRKALLMGLRTLGLLALALALAGPERVTTQPRASEEVVVLAVDQSRSMTVSEGGRERLQQAVAGASELAAEIAAEPGLRPVVVGLDTQLHPLGPEGLAGLTAVGQGTDLLSALESLPQLLDGEVPASVVVFSDGADRGALGRAWSGEDEELFGQLASQIELPLNTVALGDADRLLDLRVRFVDPPPFTFVKLASELVAEVELLGGADQRVPVSLALEGRRVATREVALSEGRGTVRFPIAPDHMGYLTAVLSVPELDDDAVPANNRAEFTLKVIRDRTRVLQITSHPSWDVKFLRRFLKTDPNLDLISFFIMRGRRERGELAYEQLSLINFPYEDLFTTDLPAFDLTVFNNFHFASVMGGDTRPYQANVRDYVRDGGALLMVGGDRSFSQGNYQRSPIADVLPTEIPAFSEPIAGPVQLRLTAEGERHPVTRLARDPATNRDLWSRLPPVDGLNRLGAPLEGGVVLVESEAGDPAIVVRNVGDGRTVAVAADSTWRWAMTPPGGASSSTYYDRFWQNVVRWLVRDAEQKQLEVLSDRENYLVGDNIQLQLRVLEDDYRPRPQQPVDVSIRPISGEGEAVQFSAETDADGIAVHTLPAAAAGTFAVEVRAPGMGLELPGQARFTVSELDPELERPEARPELLADLSEVVLGRHHAGLPELGDLLIEPTRPLGDEDRQVDPLWNHPLMLLALILPWGLEWILRRRMGLR